MDELLEFLKLNPWARALLEDDIKKPPAQRTLVPPRPMASDATRVAPKPAPAAQAPRGGTIGPAEQSVVMSGLDRFAPGVADAVRSVRRELRPKAGANPFKAAANILDLQNPLGAIEGPARAAGMAVGLLRNGGKLEVKKVGDMITALVDGKQAAVGTLGKTAEGKTFVQDLLVREPMRGQGVGKAILGALEESGEQLVRNPGVHSDGGKALEDSFFRGREPKAPEVTSPEEMLELEHYGAGAELDVIDPAQHGTGQIGAERTRREAYPDQYAPRSYFYQAGSRPEPRFNGKPSVKVAVPRKAIATPEQWAGFVQKAQETAGADRNLVATTAENLAREAGFEGYQSGNVVAKFTPTPTGRAKPGPIVFRGTNSPEHQLTSQSYRATPSFATNAQLAKAYGNQGLPNNSGGHLGAYRLNVTRPVDIGGATLGGVSQPQIASLKDLHQKLVVEGGASEDEFLDAATQVGGNGWTIFENGRPVTVNAREAWKSGDGLIHTYRIADSRALTDLAKKTGFDSWHYWGNYAGPDLDVRVGAKYNDDGLRIGAGNEIEGEEWRPFDAAGQLAPLTPEEVTGLNLPKNVIVDNVLRSDPGVDNLAAKMLAGEDGGFTLNPTTGESMAGKDLWAVAPSKETERVFTSPPSPEDIRKYREDFGELLGQEGAHIGGWHDTDTGRYVLDVSVLYPDEATAVRAGAKAQQDAIFHLGTFNTRPITPEEVTRSRVDADIGDGKAGDSVTAGFMRGEAAEPTPRFYSRLERAIQGAPFDKGTPAQWRAALSKNVAKGEREWTGVDKMLDAAEAEGRNLTRAEVGGAFKQGQINLSETTLGKSPEMRAMEEEYETLAGRKRTPEEDSRFWEISDRLFKESGGPTKFEEYTEPGGENYREILLQLDRPKSTVDAKALEKEIEAEAIAAYEAEMRASPQSYGPGEIEKYMENARSDPSGWLGGTGYWEDAHRSRGLDPQHPIGPQLETAGDFTNNHFEQPNILAHVRVKDRTLPNGEKVLFVEEIQSDWHQAGREQGYGGKTDTAPLNARREELLRQIDESRQATVTRQLEAASPEAREMLESTMRQNAYLTDSANPDINGLFGEISRIDDQLNAVATGGDKVPDAPFKKTDEWVGLAVRRLIDEAANGGYARVAFANGDQQVARYPGMPEEQKKGLRRFYDEMIPSIARDYGKKLGVRIDMGPTPTSAPDSPSELHWGMSPAEMGVWGPDGPAPIAPDPALAGTSSFPVTPTIRDKVKREGQFLYSGVDPTRVGGALLTPEGQAAAGGLLGAAAGSAADDEGSAWDGALGGGLLGAVAPSAFRGMRRMDEGGFVDPWKPQERGVFDRSAPQIQGTQPSDPRLVPQPGARSTLSQLVESIMDNPAPVRKVLDEDVERGLLLGGPEWYELGPIKADLESRAGTGALSFQEFNAMGAGASAQNSVPGEMSAMSIANYARKRGISLEEAKKIYDETTGAPRPMLAGSHMTSGVKAIEQGALLPANRGGGEWKIPSYYDKRMGGGGLLDVEAPGGMPALDTHERRRIMQGVASDPGLSWVAGETAPTEKVQKALKGMIPIRAAPDYQALSRFYTEGADRYGLPSAGAYQAARWLGGGKHTGLQTAAAGDFIQLLEDQLLYTAQRRGFDDSPAGLRDLWGRVVRGDDFILPWASKKPLPLKPQTKK